jgi:transcriptional regulator with XRE-family HTH domain
MNLERIKSLAERQRIPFKTLAAKIGMSEGNLHRCVRENRIQASDLELIAIELQVDVNEFFDCPVVAADEPSTTNNDCNTDFTRLQDNIAYLERMLEDKDRQLDSAKDDASRYLSIIEQLIRDK